MGGEGDGGGLSGVVNTRAACAIGASVRHRNACAALIYLSLYTIYIWIYVYMFVTLSIYITYYIYWPIYFMGKMAI